MPVQAGRPWPPVVNSAVGAAVISHRRICGSPVPARRPRLGLNLGWGRCVWSAAGALFELFQVNYVTVGELLSDRPLETICPNYRVV
jgi:hypothetical protein